MDTSMLWFDDDAKSTIEDKVRKAAKRFNERYGKKANLCLVHQSMLAADGDKGMTVDGITVRAWKSVIQSHLMIGVEDGSSLAQPAAVAEGEK